MTCFYRQRSPEHIKQIAKRGTVNADNSEPTMTDFVARDREGRLPKIKAADQRVAKHRKNSK